MTKYAKIHILMAPSILRITSQVEHTKEHSGIDSESQSVKWNANHQNHSTMCFYMLLWYTVLPYGKKTFMVWTERSGAKCWLTKHTWLFQSIGLQRLILSVLQANEWVALLSNRRKEHRSPKARAKASYNSVLVEGNLDDWFHYVFVEPFFALDAWQWKYVRTYAWINI